MGSAVTFAANMVGFGLAPPVLGALSDAFGQHFGDPSAGLRWALLAAGIVYPWTALHFALASRTVAEDLEV
jgi:hypothetical protein